MARARNNCCEWWRDLWGPWLAGIYSQETARSLKCFRFVCLNFSTRDLQMLLMNWTYDGDWSLWSVLPAKRKFRLFCLQGIIMSTSTDQLLISSVCLFYDLLVEIVEFQFGSFDQKLSGPPIPAWRYNLLYDFDKSKRKRENDDSLSSSLSDRTSHISLSNIVKIECLCLCVTQACLQVLWFVRTDETEISSSIIWWW